LRAICPVPAGGMSLARVPELIRFYGRDCALLIGGDLHAQGQDLTSSCRGFLESVTSTARLKCADDSHRKSSQSANNVN